MRRMFLTICILTLLFPLFSRDDPEYLFKRLSLDEGLTNSSVSSIQQDSKGFMWFGTQSGFSRYDGYDFKTWNHDTFNRDSLPHSLVQTMYMDDEDILWLGTYNGLSRFDPSTESFINYEYIEDSENSISNSVVTSLIKTSKDTLWVGTLNGLNKLDLHSEKVTRYFHDESNENSLAHNAVRSLLVDSMNRLWIGTYNGLDLYDPQTDSFKHYNDFPSLYVMSLLEHNDTELLLGVWGSGLIKFNTSTGEWKVTELNDNRVYTLGKDDVGEIWIGTWGGGLFVYDEIKNEIHELANDSSDFSSLPHNTVYSLFLDKTGVMWTGTNGGGIAIHNPRLRNYNFLVHDSRAEQSIALGKVGAIKEDKHKDLWIGIYNGGVNHYNHDTGEITHYTYDDENPRISDNIVNHIYIDSLDNIWAATNNGLNLFNSEKDRFERVNTIEETPDETMTYNVLFEDSQQNLWIGTHNHGLIRYDFESGETELFENDPLNKSSISDNLVYSIMERKNGEFWVGTNIGLNIMNREAGTFERILLDHNNRKGINNNAVRVLLERDNHEIWIGTGGGGINIYSEDSKSFSHLTKADGLSNAFIMSLIEDPKGRIWAGTKYGLSIIDPPSMAITVLSKENGLEDMEFNLGIELTQDDSVLMGASDRVYRFDIDQEESVNTIESLQILRLENGGEINRDYSPYVTNEEITMEYSSSRIISFEYSALNYIDAPNTRYIYTLEGFDENWSRESERRYVTYTNIPWGEYTFAVKAYNTFNKELFETTSQKVIILPPFWMSWWAFLLYALMASSFVYLILLATQNHTRKLRFLEIQKAETYLAGIFDSMPSLLIAIDKDLHITQWNGEAANQYGKSSSQAIGLPLYDVCPDFPVARKDLLKSIGSGDLISKMIRHNKDDRPIRFESVSIYPLNIKSRDGAVIKIDDVTKQIRMEEALVQSEKMLSIGGLAAGMAHEINNPLGGMIQSANVLENRLIKESPKNAKAALESGATFELVKSYMEKREVPRLLASIEEAGRRISDIVDNMLGFSRKENSTFSMVELPLLINKTLDLTSSDYDLKKSYDFKSIKILKDFREVPPIPCEKSQIQQVLLNILRNGAEAMKEKEGSHKFTIRLYQDRSQDMAVIEIEDNGTGMTADIKNRVFEPFFTTKPVGIGTGLGLSVSYFIITEHHHGKISVQSRPGEGSVFTIKLPIEKN